MLLKQSLLQLLFNFSCWPVIKSFNVFDMPIKKQKQKEKNERKKERIKERKKENTLFQVFLLNVSVINFLTHFL